jgi:hypothetical protein
LHWQAGFGTDLTQTAGRFLFHKHVILDAVKLSQWSTYCINNLDPPKCASVHGSQSNGQQVMVKGIQSPTSRL